jgi:adenylosuccinate lyase
LGHTFLAWKNVTHGMSRVDADEERIKSELNAHWEVVSEGAQTILRAAGQGDAYESLKSQTRGGQMDRGSYRLWVESLDIDAITREKLMSLSPETYIGVAIRITNDVIARSETTKQSPV